MSAPNPALVPPPGSDAAIAAGCTCPAVDNHYGRGYYSIPYYGRLFIFNLDCPFHGDPLSDLTMRPRTGAGGAADADADAE